LDISSAALFFRDIPKTFVDIKNNYFRYRKTFFLISKILVFFWISQNIISDIRKKLFRISKIKYPFSGIFDMQNTYFWYLKLLFLISRRRRLFRISQIVT